MSFNRNLLGNNDKQSAVSNDDLFHTIAKNSFHTGKSDVIKSFKRKYDDIEDTREIQQHCTGTQYSGVNSCIFDEKLMSEVKSVLIALCDSCASNLADECDSRITDERNYAKESVQGSTLAQIYSSESNKDDFHNTVFKHTFDTSTGSKSDEKIINSLKPRCYDSEGGMCNPCASDVVCDYDSLTSDGKGSDKESTQNSRSVLAQTYSVRQNNIEECRSRMMLNFNAIQNMHITESKKYPDNFLERNSSKDLTQSHLKSTEDHVNVKLENKASETKPVSSDTSYFLQENLEPFGINSENSVKSDTNVSKCLSESSVLFGIGDPESNSTYLDNKKRTKFAKDIPESLTTYALENFETLAFNENNEQLLKPNKACQSITKKTEYLPESPILCESSDSEPDFGYRNSKKHKPDFHKDLSESLAIYHLEDSETLTFNKNNEHVSKTNETSQSITMETENNIELDNQNSEVSSQDNKCISMVTLNVDATVQHHKTDVKFANKESDSNFRSADKTENENSNQEIIFTDPTADFANFGNMDRAIKERDIFEGNKEMQMTKEPQQFNTLDFTLNTLSTEVHVNSSSSSELIKMSNIQLQTVAEQSQSPILCESSDSEPDFGYRNSKKHKPDFHKDLTESLAIYHLEDSETLAFNKNNEHVFKTNEASQSITMETENNIELDSWNSEVSSQDNKCISMVTLNVDATVQHHKTDVKFANKESDSNFRSADKTENENSDQEIIFTDPTADFVNFGNMDRAIKESDIFEGNKEMQMPKEPQQYNTLDFTLNALSTEVHVNSSSSELIKMSNIQLQTVAEQSQRVTKPESLVPLTSPFTQPNNEHSKRKRHHSAMHKTSPISSGYIQEIVKEYKENIKLREFTIKDVVDYIIEKIPEVPRLKAMHGSRDFFMNNLKNKTLVFNNEKYRAACNTLDTFAENSERNTTSERLTRTGNSLKKMKNHNQTEKSDELIDEVNKNATVSSCMSPSGVSTDHSINESGITEKRNDMNNLNEHEGRTDLNKASNTTKRLNETRMSDVASELKESSGDSHTKCQN